MRGPPRHWLLAAAAYGHQEALANVDWRTPVDHIPVPLQMYDKIEGLYNKSNEPYFSSFDLLTDYGRYVKISGQDVIDNTNLFKRAGLPWPIRLAMSQAKIDPYYTRFDSELQYEFDEGTEDGYGVLEVMDLK